MMESFFLILSFAFAGFFPKVAALSQPSSPALFFYA
jgi:hypothetical protein